MAALDIEQPDALIAYLRETGRIRADETPRVRRLTGGVSNRTMLVQRDGLGESWVLKQALEKLRVEVEWRSDPGRIRHEAEGLRWMEKLTPPGSTTPLVFEDRRQDLLAMRAVPEPHENWKTMLLAGEVRDDHVRQFGALLGAIQASAERHRDRLSVVFDDLSFFESLRLEPYFAYSAERVPEAAAFLRGLIDSCRRERFTLVHGDYSPKNVLVHEEKLVLLDPEVVHFGDGAFDVGFAITHLLSKAHHLPDRRRAFAEAARGFWDSYRSAAGDAPGSAGLEGRSVRCALGCLLARVAGRSPLEYLDRAQRDRQHRVVVAMMGWPPNTVSELVDRFVELI